MKGFVLALQFNGNPQVIDRVRREAATWSPFRELSPEESARFWHSLENVTPRHLEKFREGAVVRLSGTLSSIGQAIVSAEAA
jgi:hypothetical protein